MKNDRYFPILVFVILAGVITSFASVAASSDTVVRAAAEVQPVTFVSAENQTN